MPKGITPHGEGNPLVAHLSSNLFIFCFFVPGAEAQEDFYREEGRLPSVPGVVQLPRRGGRVRAGRAQGHMHAAAAATRKR